MRLSDPLRLRQVDQMRHSQLRAIGSLTLLIASVWVKMGIGEVNPGSSQNDTARTSELDTILTYSASRIIFTFQPRTTILQGNAEIRYQDMRLEAPYIMVNWDENLLQAHSGEDTAQIADSTPNADLEKLERPENVKSREGVQSQSTHQLPSESSPIASTSISPFSPPKDLPTLPQPLPKEVVKMVDGEQVIVGLSLQYNLKTRQGRVVEGHTQYQDGWYRGRAIKRPEEKSYNIRSCFYTTCDAPEPHYGFWSRDMKLIVKDKVIARPIVLMFGPVPVLAVPFGIFPARGGRRSGLLVPTYGESSSQGRFLTGLGYYWAPNDYCDFKTQLDFYERYGILIREEIAYAWRYRLNGNLSGSYVNQRREGAALRRWDLGFNHNQQLSPTAQLSASGYFLSDRSYLHDLSLNPKERLQRIIRSDATITKRWIGSPWTAAINLHQEEDLESGAWYHVFPQLSLSRNSSPLFSPPLQTPADLQPWWSKVYFNYRLQGLNTQRLNVSTQTNPPLRDRQDRWGIRHDLNLTATLKPLGIFNFTPRINYTEAWLDRWFTYQLRDSLTVDTTLHYRPKARRTFNVGAGFSTSLYGLFYPHLGGLEAIRHTLSPSLSFTYTPDFSQPHWGYYDIFPYRGRKNYYDRFAGNLFGATPKLRQESLGMSLENIIEYKRKRGGDTIKRTLLSLNLSTSHNLAADSLKWAPLTTSARIPPLTDAQGGGTISGLGLDINATHSFYRLSYDSITGHYNLINKPAKGGLRLEGIDLSTSLRLSGIGRPFGVQEGLPSEPSPSNQMDRFRPPTWQPSPNPYQLAVSLRYSVRRPDPTQTQKDFWASLSGELQVTRNWKVNASSTLDIYRKTLTTLQFSIFRDLHCWQGSFTWNPRGAFSGYYLHIGVKSPHLKDVKVEKREGYGGFWGW